MLLSVNSPISFLDYSQTFHRLSDEHTREKEKKKKKKKKARKKKEKKKKERRNPHKK